MLQPLRQLKEEWVGSALLLGSSLLPLGISPPVGFKKTLEPISWLLVPLGDTCNLKRNCRHFWVDIDKVDTLLDGPRDSDWLIASRCGRER
jgi:hypothetical protein